MKVATVWLVMVALALGTESLGRTWQVSTGRAGGKNMFHRIMNQAQPAAQPAQISAYHCGPELTTRDYEQAPLSNPPRPEPSADTSFLREPAHNIAAVLNILASTSTGSAAMTEFLPRYEAGEITIRRVTPDQLRAHGHPGAAAVFQINGRTKTIFADLNVEAGRLAPLLFHEIVHALDSEIIDADRKDRLFKGRVVSIFNKMIDGATQRTGKQESALEISDFRPQDIREAVATKDAIDQAWEVNEYRAERRAYNAQFNMLQELAARYPAYYQRFDVSLLPDANVMAFSGLNVHVIEKYKAGACAIIR